MIYEVIHKTSYEYDDPVSLSQHSLRLRPRDSKWQHCARFDLSIEPHPRKTDFFRDYFDNHTAFVSIESPHDRLVIVSRSTVRTGASKLPPPDETPSWEQVRDLSRGIQIGAALEASEFLFDSPLVKTADEFAAYAARSFEKGRPILEAVLHLTARMHEEFKFDAEATTVSTPVEEVLRDRRGVCQDFAHLQIACLRSLGLPARYVSGYIETIPPPGKKKLAGSDASHAWISFYCPGLGWIDVDPTNNLLAAEQHVTVAHGRDYSDISPVRGVILGSGRHAVTVAVDVHPIAST